MARFFCIRSLPHLASKDAVKKIVHTNIPVTFCRARPLDGQAPPLGPSKGGNYPSVTLTWFV